MHWVVSFIFDTCHTVIPVVMGITCLRMEMTEDIFRTISRQPHPYQQLPYKWDCRWWSDFFSCSGRWVLRYIRKHLHQWKCGDCNTDVNDQTKMNSTNDDSNEVALAENAEPLGVGQTTPTGKLKLLTKMRRPRCLHNRRWFGRTILSP